MVQSQEIIAVLYKGDQDIFLGQPQETDYTKSHDITLVEPLILNRNFIFLSDMSDTNNKKYDDFSCTFEQRLRREYDGLILKSPFYKERAKTKEGSPRPITLQGLEGRIIIPLGRIEIKTDSEDKSSTQDS